MDLVGKIIVVIFVFGIIYVILKKLNELDEKLKVSPPSYYNSWFENVMDTLCLEKGYRALHYDLRNYIDFEKKVKSGKYPIWWDSYKPKTKIPEDLPKHKIAEWIDKKNNWHTTLLSNYDGKGNNYGPPKGKNTTIYHDTDCENDLD